MSFLQPDEHIILMDCPALLSLDDLKRIREAGVRTLFAYASWHQIEQQPGVYDWATADAWVDRAAQADMQVLLRCYEHAPAGFPDDWYLRTAAGVLWREFAGWGGGTLCTLLSPWCPAAMAAEDDFLRACRERYAGAPVLCYAGVAHSGEVLLPGMVDSYYDEYALADFRAYRDGAEAVPSDLPTYASMNAQPGTVSWLRDRLYTYVVQHQQHCPEIWLSLVERDTPFAEAFECGPRSGNWLMRELCANLPAQLDKDLNILLFEVYRPGGLQGALDNVRGYEHCTWVGSQFCEGLYANTEDAIARGLRGFITAPLHPEQRGGRLEAWMLDAMRWSLARWREART